MTDFILTEQQLYKIIPGNQYTHDWYNALVKFLPNYDIITTQRIAAFLAQCGHESNGFTALKENLNYRAETLMRIWPKLYPTLEIANQYAHKPEMIANRSYGNKLGNGNEASGDGFKFCGRGLIQLTGHDNYKAFATSAQLNIDELPAYLVGFEGAVHSACWFWDSRNINVPADAGDVEKTTKLINGGTLGLEERTSRYNQALSVLGG
jgi:putative chitinase